MIEDLRERYELAVYAYLDMAEDRYRTGQDTGAAVRWELYHAAEGLRAAGMREHELNEFQSVAMVKLAALRLVTCTCGIMPPSWLAEREVCGCVHRASKHQAVSR